MFSLLVNVLLFVSFFLWNYPINVVVFHEHIYIFLLIFILIFFFVLTGCDGVFAALVKRFFFFSLSVFVGRGLDLLEGTWREVYFGQTAGTRLSVWTVQVCGLA